MVRTLNELESCTGVERPDLVESFVQLSCTWPNEMRVVRELSSQILDESFVQLSCTWSNEKRVVRELTSQIWTRVLFNSRARGQMRVKIV